MTTEELHEILDDENRKLTADEKPMHLCSECEIKFNEFWENKE